MTTVASLQIKIGADVSAAINGMNRSEYAAQRVAESFDKAGESSTTYGTLAAIAGQKVAQAAQGAQRILNNVNFDKITQEGEKAFNKIQKVIDLTANAGNAATLIGAGFVKAQQVGNVALTAIGAAIPRVGLAIAGLAGPIGIAIGVVGGLVGGLIAMKTAQDNTINSQKELNNQIRTETVEMTAMLGVLRDNNLNYKTRGELIEKINSKYGTTLKNIKDENAFVTQLDKAYQDLATSIKNKILIDAQQESIKALVSDIIKLEGSIEGLKKQNSEGADLLASLGGTPGQIEKQTQTTTGLIDAFTESLNQKQGQLKSATEKVAKLFNGVIFGDGSGKGKKNVDEVRKAYEDLENSLTSIQTKLANNLIKPIDVDDLQVDAFTQAINRLIQLDPTGKAAQDAINRYKGFFDRTPLSINALIIPQLENLDNKGAGNAANKALKDINAAFSKQLIKIRIDALPDGTSKLDDFINKYIGKIKEAVAFTAQIGGQLLNIASLAGNYENRLDNLEEYYNKESELIDNSVAADSVKTARKKALEDDLNRKRKAVLREQAQGAKLSSIFNATINTAQAVTKALAEGGPIYAAAVGALGAVEIALIASQPVPALASGALISGPNTVLVGEYPGASSNPELIAPVKKVQSYIVEAVQTASSGTSQLIGILRNDDLYFMIERAEQRKFRTG